MKRHFIITVCWLALVFLAAHMGMGQIVDHPSKLQYEPFTYEPPKPKDARVELENGMIVYIKEDHLLPTLDVSAIIRTGSLYEPKDKVGLARMTGSVVRTGGTSSISGDDLDERLAYLGGSIRTSIRTTSGSASLSVLMKDADEGLRLFADVLMNPAFSEDKIALYKDEAIHDIKNKNDSPRSVLGREFNKLLYKDHPLVWEATQASIEGITQQDLIDFHAKNFAPNNMILSVAGDFEKQEMLKKLEAAFEGWPQKTVTLPSLPEVEVLNRPGVFMVQKEINQGYINVGHFGIKDTNPDVFAVDVMNFILGGGSFTSRITTKVRSDEGLAYNTGCVFSNRHLFPGTFYGYVQTKSSTVWYAISLILAEFEGIRNEPVKDEEIETAKSYYLESFPSRFESTRRTMSAFADLEYNGFPMDYYDTYREKYLAVTKDDVMRVARKYIHPEAMSIFIVGDIDACKAGSEKHPGKLEDLGEISVIELMDPLTGEPPEREEPTRGSGEVGQ